MDLNSCQWFGAYAESLYKFWLKGCSCNAGAFGIATHYNDNLNNGKRGDYFRAKEKKKRDAPLLTSGINKIICELMRDGQISRGEKLIGNADVVSCDKGKDTDTERRKLGEKTKEVGNPWVEGRTVCVSAVKANCLWDFWILIIRFVPKSNRLSCRSLHLIGGTTRITVFLVKKTDNTKCKGD